MRAARIPGGESHSARRQRWPSRVSSTRMPRLGKNRPQPVRSGPVLSGSGGRPLVEELLQFRVEGFLRGRRDPQNAVEIADEGRRATGVGRRERPGVDAPVELADQIEDRGQGRRDVEVVVQSGFEGRPGAVEQGGQRGVVRAVGAVGRKRREQRVEPVDGRARRLRASRRRTRATSGSGPRSGPAAAPAAETPPSRTSPTRAMLPSDLAIFWPPIWRMGAVEPVARRRSGRSPPRSGRSRPGGAGR